MITSDEVKQMLDYDPETGWFTWKCQVAQCVKPGRTAGTLHSKGYVSLKIKGRRYYAHRLAWLLMTGDWPSDQIDHINGDRQDNSWTNLRQATNAENGRNQKLRKDNRLGIKGVRWVEKERKFGTKIRVNGVDKHIGYFDSAHEAHAAYCAAAEKFFGEFARSA